MKTTIRWTAGLALIVLGAGCELIAGLGDPQLDEGSGGKGGAGGATALCSDGVKNGGETGKDCGGSCSPCPVGGGCAVGPDCESKVCIGGSCATPACDDKVKNGDELDVDCGGSCGKCGAGKACGGDQDCKSGTCTGGACASTCVDAEKGGSETDVDCGGGVASGCSTCAIGRGCKTIGDCQSGVCDGAACVDYHIWSKRLDYAGIGGIAVDVQGNALLTGSLVGTVDWGGGPLTEAGGGDVIVGKFDSAGNHFWSKRFGDMQAQFASSVAVSSANDIFITGKFDGVLNFDGFGALVGQGGGDVFVGQLNSAGGGGWNKAFGDVKVQAGKKVVVGKSGDVVVSGVLAGDADFGGGKLSGAGSTDYFLAKFDQVLGHVWSRAVVGPNSKSASNVGIDAKGDILTFGDFLGSLDVGTGTLTSAGDSDVLIAKYDGLSGAPLWSHRYGDSNYQKSTGVVSGDSTDLIVAGVFYGDLDFGKGALTAGLTDADIFVAKLDASGTCLWSKRFGDPAQNDTVRSIGSDSAGNVVLVGLSNGSIDFGGGPLQGPFLVKLDALGEHLWSRSFVATQASAIWGVAVYDPTHVLVWGTFGGTIDLGGDLLTSTTMQDLFVAKLRLP